MMACMIQDTQLCSSGGEIYLRETGDVPNKGYVVRDRPCSTRLHQPVACIHGSNTSESGGESPETRCMYGEEEHHLNIVTMALVLTADCGLHQSCKSRSSDRNERHYTSCNTVRSWEQWLCTQRRPAWGGSNNSQLLVGKVLAQCVGWKEG